MTAVIDEVVSTLSTRRHAAASAFAALVRDIADGDPRDADDIIVVLDDADRTPDDLSAAVDLLVRRRQLAVLAGTLPDAERDALQADANVTAADRQLSAAQEQHAQAVEQGRREYHVAARRVQAAQAAAKELRDGCHNAEILGKLDELRGRQQEVQTRRKLAADRLQLSEENAHKNRHRTTHGCDRDREVAQERLLDCQRAGTEAQEEIAACDTELGRIADDMDRVRQQMLQP